MFNFSLKPDILRAVNNDMLVKIMQYKIVEQAWFPILKSQFLPKKNRFLQEKNKPVYWNRTSAWMPTQCNPYFRVNSVCRCCCQTDGCNKIDNFCSDSKYSDKVESQIECPILKLTNGLEFSCSNQRKKGSTCDFSHEFEFNNENVLSIKIKKMKTLIVLIQNVIIHWDWHK